MPVYFCRWPGGSFSVVGAANKDDAILLLDQVGCAYSEMVKAVPKFLMTFHLSEDQKQEAGMASDFLEIESFGEETSEHIENVYPLFSKMLPEIHELSAEERNPKIRKAIAQEIERVVSKDHVQTPLEETLNINPDVLKKYAAR